MVTRSCQYQVADFFKKADRVSDYIPLVSTAVNLFDLFQKTVVIPAINLSGMKKNHYFEYIERKSWGRCLLTTLPVLGNIAIAIHDHIDSEYRSHILGLIKKNPSEGYYWMLFFIRFKDAEDQVEFLLDLFQPVAAIEKNTLPLDIGYLPVKWRSNWGFLKRALETYPYLNTCAEFWEGCLEYHPNTINEPEFKNFLKSDPGFYKKLILKRLEWVPSKDASGNNLRVYKNIPWAFEESESSLKKETSKAILLKAIDEMTEAERDKIRSLAIKKYPQLLNLFKMEQLESALSRIGIFNEEGFLLQVFIYKNSGKIQNTDFYKIIIDRQKDLKGFGRSLVFRCSSPVDPIVRKDYYVDNIDERLRKNIILDACDFDIEYFKSINSYLRSDAGYLSDLFLKRPEIFRLYGSDIGVELMSRVFDKVIAEKGKEALTKLQKEIIVLELSKNPFSQFRSPTQVLATTKTKSLTKSEKNEIINELIQKGSGLRRFSEEEIKEVIEGGLASSQEISNLNHYLTETNVIIWDVYLEFCPDTHDNSCFKAFLEKNPDFYRGYVLRSLERGLKRDIRGDFIRSFNHIPWVLEEGGPPEEREASRAIVLKAIAQMTEKEKDQALLNAAVCCPQFLDLFSNEDLEATLVRNAFLGLYFWYYLQLHFYKRGGRVIDELCYRYVIEVSRRRGDSLYEGCFRCVDEKLKENFFLEACLYDDTLFGNLPVTLRNDVDFLIKIFLRKPEMFLWSDFFKYNYIKSAAFQKIAAHRGSWVLTPIQIEIILSHLCDDPQTLDAFTEQEILAVIPHVQMDQRRDCLKQYVIKNFILRRFESAREARSKGVDVVLNSISNFKCHYSVLVLVVDIGTYKPYWRIKLPKEKAILIDAETLSCDEVLRKIEVMKRFLARQEALLTDRQIGHLALKRGIAELGVATGTPPAPEGVSIDELQELYERYEFPKKEALRKSFLNYVEAVKKHEEDMPQMYKEALHIIKKLKESEDPDQVVTNLCYLAKDGELCAHGAHVENTLHVYRTLFNLLDIVAASEGVKPLVFSASLRALKRAAEKISAECTESRHAYLYAMHCLRKEEYPIPDSFGGIDSDIYGNGKEFWGGKAGFWSDFPEAYLKNLLVQVFNEANKKIKSDSKFIDLISHELKGYVREQLIPLEVEKLAAEAMEKLAPLTEGLKKIELKMGQMKSASTEAARAFLDKKLSILKRQKEALEAEIQAIRLARERDIDNLIVETIEDKKFLRYSSKGEASLTLEGAAALMEHYKIIN